MKDTSIKKRPTKKTTKKNISTKKRKISLQRKEDNLLLAFVGFVFLVLLLLISNKTFFKTSYDNGKIKIDIPAFLYFVNDKDNVITFKTLRKSEYIKEYFDEYLSNLNNYDYYVCGQGKSVYYNEKTNVVIYDIVVRKNIALKTIKINYDIKDPGKVCE